MNITTHVLADYPEPRKKPRAKPWTITERRKEVLYWLARGKTTPEIADILNLSFFTAKNHVCEILKIYGTPNRTCAVLRAIARGDISLDEILREFA